MSRGKEASLSEVDVEVRSVQLEIMKQRLLDCEDRVNSALESINFDIDDNITPLFQCPIDTRHFIPIESQQKHVETCRYHKEGIGSEDIREFGARTGDKGLVLISNSLEEEILSKVRGSRSDECAGILEAILRDRESQDETYLQKELRGSLHYSHEVLQRTRTAQQRSTLYDYAVLRNKRTAPEVLATLPDPFDRVKYGKQQDETDPAVLEKLKELRNSKRRRKTYKGGKGIRLKSLREQTKSLVDLYMNSFCTEEGRSSGSDSRERGEKRGRCEEERKQKYRGHRDKKHKHHMN